MPRFSKEKGSRRNVDKSRIQSAELQRQYAKGLTKSNDEYLVYRFGTSRFPLYRKGEPLQGEGSQPGCHLQFAFHVAVRENRGCIGDYVISLGHTEPSRKVLTSGDWATAWNLVIKAASFPFPHRRDELDAYEEYTQREFTARQADAHWKIIHFDQSIRK
jgi:hypothetical protein